MAKLGLRQKPTYWLESVDNALGLIELLRDLGGVRLTDAARELSIAPSTAHRLLGMLVYRGFAVKNPDRRYYAGPALSPGLATADAARGLRERARPYMEELSRSVGETVNLMIRSESTVRFIATVESPQLLRVGDRQGTVLPAARTSGGKAMLAALGDEEARRVLDESGDDVSRAERTTVLRELQAVRDQGFAINRESSEIGVSAVGVAISRAPDAALTVSMPTARFASFLDSGRIVALIEAGNRLSADLATDLDPVH